MWNHGGTLISRMYLTTEDAPSVKIWTSIKLYPDERNSISQSFDVPGRFLMHTENELKAQCNRAFPVEVMNVTVPLTTPILTMSGSDYQNSYPFEVPEGKPTWVLRWAKEGIDSRFNIVLYEDGTSLRTLLATEETDRLSGTLLVTEYGEFQLRVRSLVPWTVSVEFFD